MRRPLIVIALVSAALVAPRAEAVGGCSPVPCTISGILSGGNIVPSDTFSWTLAFNGAEAYNGYVYRQPPARLFGTARRVRVAGAGLPPILGMETYVDVSGWEVRGWLDAGYGHHYVLVTGTLVSTRDGVAGTLTGTVGAGRATATVLTIQGSTLVGAVHATWSSSVPI